MVRILADIGHHQAAHGLHRAAVGDLLPQQQLQQAGLAAAVCALEGDPLPRQHLEGDLPADPATVVAHGYVPELRQPRTRPAGQGRNRQRLLPLQVLQQLLLLLHCLLPAALDGFGPLHQLGRLVAHKAPVRRLGPGLVHAELTLLRPVRPAGGTAGGLRQPPDVLLQLLLPGQLEGVLPPAVLPPGGEIPPLDLNIGPVDGQNMVHTLVQERPVMGYQQKSPLPGQIAPQLPPSLQVQMVGGLVDQQEGILLQKHGRQQHLGPLPVGEAGKGQLQ